MIKPKTSISVKGEWSHKHIQIVALKGSTAAINEALIGPIRLTPIRYIQKAKTAPIIIIPAIDK